MGEDSSGSRKDSMNGPRDQEQYRNEQQNDQRGKYYYPEYIQRKLAITVLATTLALFALAMILYRIIKGSNEQYNEIVLSQRQRECDSRIVPYRRGDIVDRNGTYLATSEKTYSPIIDPGQIMSDPENHLGPTIQVPVINSGFDAGELRTLIEERREPAYLRYNKGHQFACDQRVAFEQMTRETDEAYRRSDNDTDARKRVKSTWSENEYKRIYPHNPLACSVVGSTSSDGGVDIGDIEQYHNSSLIGISGREYGCLGQDSNLEGVVKLTVGGNTVVSIIDVSIQNIVQKYIDEWQADVRNKVTAAIVMNPNDGEILAMGTGNKFDLNNPRDMSGYTEQGLLDLEKREIAAVYRRENDDAVITEGQVLKHFSREDVISYRQQVTWSQIWRGFCASDTYEPGSPSKIFTVVIGLGKGVLKGNENSKCTGYLHVGDHDVKYTAWHRGGHEWLNLQGSLIQSYNAAMMYTGVMIEKERFTKYQGVFGFGDKTGVDLSGEADTSGLVYSADGVGPTDLTTNAFGQSYNYTMVQLSTVLYSVLNGDSYYEPHVVKQILSEQGSVVEEKKPVLMRETVSQSTSDSLKEVMFQTVETGTGEAAQVIGYDVGGKAGAAEKQPRSVKNYLVSFAEFAPIEDPQVFMHVVIDAPNYPPGEQQAHSSYASAVFSKVMTEILPYLNILPTEDLPENEALQESLPSSEGINEPAAGVEGAKEAGKTPAEIEKQYKTDEYIPGRDEGEGAGSDVPDAVPTAARDGGREGIGPKSLPAQAPPRRTNENGGQAGPGRESSRAAEPSAAEETARQSE